MNLVRVRNTETGAEFGLEGDCFAHGAASYRIGLERADNPFRDAISDRSQSWELGWECAEHFSKKSTGDSNG